MSIIGISGFAGSGKDTIADIFVSKYGFVKMSLADPLKRFCKEVFDFSNDQLWGPSEYRNKEDKRYNNLTARYALQTLGTEWGRKCYDDVWIDYAIRQAKRVLASGCASYSPQRGITYGDIVDSEYKLPTVGVIIPDCRFNNEINKIKESGGKIIRVIRSGVGLSKEFGEHQSELEMSKMEDDTFDYIIYNNGSLEDLEIKIEELYNCLKI